MWIHSSYIIEGMVEASTISSDKLTWTEDLRCSIKRSEHQSLLLLLFLFWGRILHIYQNIAAEAQIKIDLCKPNGVRSYRSSCEVASHQLSCHFFCYKNCCQCQKKIHWMPKIILNFPKYDDFQQKSNGWNTQIKEIAGGAKDFNQCTFSAWQQNIRKWIPPMDSNSLTAGGLHIKNCKRWPWTNSCNWAPKMSDIRFDSCGSQLSKSNVNTIRLITAIITYLHNSTSWVHL